VPIALRDASWRLSREPPIGAPTGMTFDPRRPGPTTVILSWLTKYYPDAGLPRRSIQDTGGRVATLDECPRVDGSGRATGSCETGRRSLPASPGPPLAPNAKPGRDLADAVPGVVGPSKMRESSVTLRSAARHMRVLYRSFGRDLKPKSGVSSQ
jgi:hypothetical protein